MVDERLLNVFLTCAEELHFGRAAHRIGLQPAAVSRDVRLLEDELGVSLFRRTTRQVTLTACGEALLADVPQILALMKMAAQRVRDVGKNTTRILRVGAIDSAATGMMPQLVHDFRDLFPEVELILIEDKTVKLLPRLATGSLDLAFVRPPPSGYPQVDFTFLLHEQVVVAIAEDHPLASQPRISVHDLADVPLIVPSARNRPHSYQLTHRLFQEVGQRLRIAQHADEKHTIVRLVGAGVGAAIVPFWTSRLMVEGVVYRPLERESGSAAHELPLAIARLHGSSDTALDALAQLATDRLDSYCV